MKKEHILNTVQNSTIQNSSAGVFLSRFRRSFKESRKYQRLSQHEVAIRMNTKQPVIARFESGQIKNPSIDFIFKSVVALDMRLDFRIILKNGRKMLS